MKGLLAKLIKNLHWLIIIKMAFDVYAKYNRHEEEVIQVQNRIRAVAGKIKKARKQQELLQSFQENLSASKQRVEEVAQQIESVQRQLPNTISDTEILDAFMSEATSINIRDIFLTPKEEHNRGFYFAKEYEFKGSGTFLQFMIFFERIANLERILNVKEIVMSSSGKKRKGRFQLVDVTTVLEAYRYNSAHKEDRGIKAIEEQFKAGGPPSGKRARARARSKSKDAKK